MIALSVAVILLVVSILLVAIKVGGQGKEISVIRDRIEGVVLKKDDETFYVGIEPQINFLETQISGIRSKLNDICDIAMTAREETRMLVPTLNNTNGLYHSISDLQEKFMALLDNFGLGVTKVKEHYEVVKEKVEK